MANFLLGCCLLLSLFIASPPRTLSPVVPTINNIGLVVTCDTSVLINFSTSTASHSYIEYGFTAGYGSSTIDDPVRFYKEHVVPLTGLTANTTYHYRVVATDASGSTSTGDASFITAANGTACPAQPVQVDSRMPDMTGAVEKTIKAGGGDYTPTQFQTALNDAGSANEKRIITVDVGLTLTGQWTLPVNSDGNWIIVRSSAYASLTEGVRVNSGQSGLMFRIQNTNTDAPLTTATSAQHWRFIGAEITISSSAQADAPAGFSQSGLVRIGSAAETSAGQLPHHIIFDRCYIHGLPTKNDTRGIYANGEDLAFIDNYLNEFHDTGRDSQAILSGMAKRVKVLNNHLEGAGENFMTGGVGITIPGYFPSDIDYQRNYHIWPLRWKSNDPSFAGFDWVTKNQFEVKNGQRILIFGNVWEQWWPSEQTSGPINMKTSNEDTTAPTLGADISFYKNIVRKTGMGLIQQARDSQPALQSDLYSKRCWYFHNIVEVDGATWTNEDTGAPPVATAMMVFAAFAPDWQYPDYVNVIHNTFVNANPTPIGATGGNSIQLNGQSISHKGVGFIYQDNIVGNREFGVKADGTGSGTVALNVAFTGYTWTKNLVVGGNVGDYPVGNIFETAWAAVLFVNFNNGVGGNYRLQAGSPGHNAASDGTDIGANIDGVDRATEFTITGNWLHAIGTVNISGKVTISGKTTP